MLASNSHAPLPLRSNTGASLAAESTSDWRLAPLPSGQLARDLAWREGNIALQGETLAQAAAIYARYSDRTIVIADAELAKQPVTGLFAANNPLGFAEAVAEVFDADVDQDGKRIVLTRAH